MRDSHSHPIYSLFGSVAETGCVSTLSQIQQRAIMLLELNRTVNSLLPVLLRPWCRVANIRQSVIVLETANANWQMRLRYEQLQLLSALRAQILPSLSSIDIRINPSLARKYELHAQNNYSGWPFYLPIEKQQRLSVQSATSIRYIAARSRGKLKNALERLAELAGDGDSADLMPYAGNRRLTTHSTA